MQKNRKQEIINYLKNNRQFKELMAALFIFASAIIIFFYPVITKTGFFEGDFLFGFPQYLSKYISLKELQITQWNPYNLSGTPEIVSNFMISYPFNWIGTLFMQSNDIDRSYLIAELIIIFHFILGAFFTYLLARYFKINFWGAIISGLIFSLSGYLAYKSMYFSLIYSTAWLPIIFLFFHKGLHNKNFRDIAIAGFFMAISALGSYQQITFYIGLFLFFYTIFYIYTEYKKGAINASLKEKVLMIITPLEKILFIALITGGSIAIVSVHLINYYTPTWHGSNDSMAPIGSSLSPLYFIFTQVIPHYFGGVSQNEIYYGNWPVIELANYIGIMSLLLSFIAIITLLLKNNIAKFLLIIMVFFIMFAFGTNSPLYWVFYLFVPFFKIFSTPSRALLFFVFPISLLAGFGLTVLMEKMEENLKKKISLVINFLLACFFIFGTIIAFLSFYNSGSLVKKISLSYPGTNFINNSVILHDYLILLLVILLVYLVMKKWFSGSLKKPVFASSVIIILFIDLFIANSGFYSSKGSVIPGEYYKKTPAIDFLDKQDKTDYRFAANNLVNDSMDTLYKIPSVEQLAVANFRYEEYTKGFFGDFMGKMKIGPGNRLNLLNVRYLMFDKKPGEGNFQKIGGIDNLYQNLDALPRLFLVHNAETVANPNDILIKIDKKNFQPRQTILLEKPSPLKNSKINQDNNKDKAVFTYYSPDQIEIYTYSRNPSMLFLSEMYFPGWKAYVDGNPSEIYQTDYLFRSVYMDKGPHSIKMVFDPSDFKIGRGITVITMLTLLIYFIFDIIKNRKLEKSF